MGTAEHEALPLPLAAPRLPSAMTTPATVARSKMDRTVGRKDRSLTLGKTRPVSCGGSLFGVWKGRVYALISTLVLACAALSSTAAADPLPPYEGMSFPEISGPSAPEDYSWKVQLEEDQELRQVDERDAVVYFTDGEHVAFSIRAADAHDAVGKSVPTTLEVSSPNVVTLTVHHRAGNPAAGGVPFTYPILEGAGWEGGFSTFEVSMPPREPLPSWHRCRCTTASPFVVVSSAWDREHRWTRPERAGTPVIVGES